MNSLVTAFKQANTARKQSDCALTSLRKKYATSHMRAEYVAGTAHGKK